ncbi:MAG: carbohydrate kinase family protein [Anaerolineae bacterium]|nr:carbohydrate kinase family protein [Anaerolineae bacterium]
MTKVLVLGGVSINTMIYIDRFPNPQPQTVFSKGYHETLGSTGAGKALNLKKLGLDVTLHGLIGDDYYGNCIREYMERAGVPFIYDLDPQGTKRHLNLMDDNGGRISIFFAYGTYEPDIDIRRIESLIQDNDYVVLNVINYCRKLIPIIKRHNKQIWCDIHDYDGRNTYHQEFIEVADYLFLSSDALPNYKLFMQQQIERGKKLVVCTHGKDGATALTVYRQWIETPSIAAYKLRDTNGAGDSFFSGFLYGHTKGYSTNKCLRIGAIVAGLCITCQELAYPDLSEARMEIEYKKHYGDDGKIQKSCLSN